MQKAPNQNKINELIPLLIIQQEDADFQPVQMKEIESRALSTEFKDIYTSRLRMFKELAVGVRSISALNQTCFVQVMGILKRIEVKRVRNFQPHYEERYDGIKVIFSNQDTFQIQDETGKVNLKFNQNSKLEGKTIQTNILPYGITVKIKGKFKNHSNKLYVQEIVLPNLPTQNKLNHCSTQKIIIISQPTAPKLLKLYQLLKINQCLESIKSVIIIGGVGMNAKHINEMDTIFRKLGSFIKVNLMASSSKQRNQLYPLRAYNKLLFPQSANSIHFCSNPQIFQEKKSNAHILVSCGENIDWMKVNCQIQSRIEIAQWLLKYCHLCPSSPFSLKTEPYQQDPLVIKQLPNLFIHGKADQYEEGWFIREGKKVKILSMCRDSYRVISLSDFSSNQIDL